MTGQGPFHEHTDDGSQSSASVIAQHRPLGTIARSGRLPLWLGCENGAEANGWHPRLQRDATGPLPTVVSFYTPGTAYENLAAALGQSCERFGVSRRIEPRQSRGSWERNCAMKAGFVRDMRSALTGPILWVDADAHLTAPLDDLRALRADFAVHLLDGWRMLSGTILFADTPQATRLIDRWHERCEAEPDIWDQIHLDLAWEDTAREHDLTTAWLDERFAKIFDRPADIDPVIVHTQASRRHKHEVSGGNRGGEQVPDESVRLARSRSRCRPGPPQPAHACTIIADPDESAARWQQRRIETMAHAYRQCLDSGFTRIALVGAGQHTREIALPAADSIPIEIACILDDRAADIGRIGSIPVRSFASCPDGVQALVVSSDAHESALAQRCCEVFADRLPVVEPYRDAAECEALSGTGSR